MRTLPVLALLSALACAGAAAGGPFDADGVAHLPPVSSPGRPDVLAVPAAPLAVASLVTSVGEIGDATELPTPQDRAPMPSAPREAEPSPDLGAAGALWGQPARPRATRVDAPAPGLRIDASTDPAVDGPPARGRVPGAYAPYQAAPPMLEQKLDPPALLASLASRGFTDVSQLRLRGSAYICEATGPRRERVRLVVDAASGAIFGLEVIGYDSRRN